MAETKVNIVFEGAQIVGKTAAQKMQDAMRDSIMTNAIYGKSVDRGEVKFDWMTPRPRYDDWLRSMYGYQSYGRARRPEPVIPAFVEPERPVAAAEPAPEPDTPAVALLRKLLNDRKAVVANFESEIEGSLSAIEEAEQELADMRADLDHEKTCAAQAHAEVDAITADIVKLGGTVG